MLSYLLSHEFLRKVVEIFYAYKFLDSLSQCCKHFAIISKSEEKALERPEIDHLLGYYRMEGIHNEVFYYKQKTARHNEFAVTHPTGLNTQFSPIFLNFYQVSIVF